MVVVPLLFDQSKQTTTDNNKNESCGKPRQIVPKSAVFTVCGTRLATISWSLDNDDFWVSSLRRDRIAGISSHDFNNIYSHKYW